MPFLRVSKLHALQLAALLLLGSDVADSQTDSSTGPTVLPTASLIRDKITQALSHTSIAPTDLLVRDQRMWEKNAEKFREEGRLIGDFPLPGPSDPMRPPPLDRALRSPLEAISVAIELSAGIAPPTLQSLIGEPPGNRYPKLVKPVASLSHDLPQWVNQVVAILKSMETMLQSSGLNLDLRGELNAELRAQQRKKMPAWILDSIPKDDLAQARPAFNAYAAIKPKPLLDLALTLVELTQQQSTPIPSWPALTAPLQLDIDGRTVIIGTSGDDHHILDAWLLIDPGGNDLYTNNAGGAVEIGQIAVLIDLDGDDRYLSETPFSQGAAHQGIGLLIDLAGNDDYQCTSYCQGAALGGVGGLFDFGGQDQMRASQFAQGAAAFGIGLVHAAGEENDTYIIDGKGQGFSRTAGTALLQDQGGNDTYRVNDRFKSNYSQWTNGRPVFWSFAQGASLGFYLRFDETLKNGDPAPVTRELFPGGVGVLIDDHGDDTYSGSMYTQGTGYFYGLGMLIDRAGNDSYSASWYGQGAAAHFAIGILLDQAGQDSYRGINQVQGNGRDFATGVLIDIAGHDHYQAEDRSQGCGDQYDGYGILADLAGDDHYQASERSARGYATNSDPERQPSDKRPYLDAGIFLDLAGQDRYQGPAGGANHALWIDNKTRRGVGLDE
jgi:hypothetical protein